MDGKIKIKGHLKFYMQWPVILSILLIVMDALVFSVSVKAGTLVSIFLAAYILVVVFLYFHSKTMIMNELISFATQYGQVQKTLLNECFRKLQGINFQSRKIKKLISDIMREITRL